MSIPRLCYCDLWLTSPDTLRSQGIPYGYCGLCEECGDPGHMCHYPGRVAYTGSWCDVCYVIEMHRGYNRAIGGWVYNSLTEIETDIAINELEPKFLKQFISDLTAPRSALILEFTNGICFDLRVLMNNELELRFWDKPRKVRGWGVVTPEVAYKALGIALGGKDIRQAMEMMNASLEYFEG